MSADRRLVASRFANYSTAPLEVDGVTVSRTTVRSGLAAPLQNGVVHRAREAVIVRDERGLQLAVRWQCGGGSVSATPAPIGAEIACVRCAEVGDLPLGPVVYRCISGGRVIYVGSTLNLARRLQGHRATTTWWSEVDRVAADPFDTEFEARRTERGLIRTLLPLYNVDGKPAQSTA